MELVTGSWFNEVGYNFKISYKVRELIKEKFRKDIMEVFGLLEKDPTWYLNLAITTDSSIQELEVKGPGIRKRAKFIDYGLWLPHDKINHSDYPLREYIKYYFEAVKIVFANYNVPVEAFDPIREKVEKEVLNNPLYEYVEK